MRSPKRANYRLDLRETGIGRSFSLLDIFDAPIFKTLEEINLFDASIRDLPSSIQELSGLKVLDLFGSQFAIFPECLMNLPALERLSISIRRLNYLGMEAEEIRELHASNLDLHVQGGL